MLKLLSLSLVKPQQFLLIVKRLASTSQQWTAQEDEILKSFIQTNGAKWSQLVNHCLPTRTAAQCRTRWEKISYRQGSFTLEEKELVAKGIEMFGEGQWKLISQHFLPHRSPRHISFQLDILKHANKVRRWTKEEDELLLKGLSDFGRHWTQIAKVYLPHRTRTQLCARYAILKRNRSEWTAAELDLLMKRTIVLGQDWKKVAAGIPGKTPEQCQFLWKSKLDPDVDREKWSHEEVRLFWELLQRHSGNYKSVLKELPPGRDSKQLYTLFNSVVHNDDEFRSLFGEQLKQQKSENRPAWRARIAKLVSEWLDLDYTMHEGPNKSIEYVKTGPWEEEEENALKRAVEIAKTKKKFLQKRDWFEISKEVEGRTPEQCTLKYLRIVVEKNSSRSKWTEEEDRLLQALVEEHGTNNWNLVAQSIPAHNSVQCRLRWNTYVEHGMDGTCCGPFSEKEIESIIEGVQMFGTDWNAVRMTYLPHRSIYQVAQWWHRQKKNKSLSDTASLRSQRERQPWAEHEDNALKLAVAKYRDEKGVVSSWAKIARFLKNRTAKQCRTRWLFSLEPNISKGRWSPEEEMRLLDAVQRYRTGETRNIWPDVAKELSNGRSELSCRMKFYNMKKKGGYYL